MKPKTNESPSKDKPKKQHIHKWSDEMVTKAQRLFLLGNEPDKIEARIGMAARSVMRFVGKTPDDPRRLIFDNTRTSAWHDLCWEKALDQFSKIRNKQRADKGLPPLPRDNRYRRDPTKPITGCDSPSNKAKDKAKDNNKAKDRATVKAKAKVDSTPIKTSEPIPPALPLGPDQAQSSAGPVRTSLSVPRPSAFGVVADPAQTLKDRLAARKAKANTLDSSIDPASGTSSQTLAGGMPLGLEAYAALALGDATNPLPGILKNSTANKESVHF